MTTSVSIDKDIRDKAAKKAEKDKLSVSAVIRILLIDYANGKIQIGTRMTNEVNIRTIEVDKKTQSMMDDVIVQWNKNTV